MKKVKTNWHRDDEFSNRLNTKKTVPSSRTKNQEKNDLYQRVFILSGGVLSVVVIASNKKRYYLSNVTRISTNNNHEQHLVPHNIFKFDNRN